MKTMIFTNKIAFFALTIVCSLQSINAQNIDTVTSDYVYSMLTSSNFNKTIIDGRDSAMFRSGHIKNAVVIDAFNQNPN